jgi:hypothetical protein
VVAMGIAMDGRRRILGLREDELIQHVEPDRGRPPRPDSHVSLICPTAHPTRTASARPPVDYRPGASPPREQTTYGDGRRRLAPRAFRAKLLADRGFLSLAAGVAKVEVEGSSPFTRSMAPERRTPDLRRRNGASRRPRSSGNAA